MELSSPYIHHEDHLCDLYRDQQSSANRSLMKFFHQRYLKHVCPEILSCLKSTWTCIMTVTHYCHFYRACPSNPHKALATYIKLSIRSNSLRTYTSHYIESRALHHNQKATWSITHHWVEYTSSVCVCVTDDNISLLYFRVFRIIRESKMAITHYSYFIYMFICMRFHEIYSAASTSIRQHHWNPD